VHAIGGGIVLFEIQQHSDVTYRLWDYGRPREIHVEKAVPIADLGCHPGPTQGIVRSKHFVTELIQPGRFVAEPHECQLVIWIEGVHAGEVWLLPDETTVIEADGQFLRTFVPE